MGDITDNLSRHEFNCQCGCGLADPHPLLCVCIQAVFNMAEATSVWITSGSRCKWHNRALVKTNQAALGSKHQPDPERGDYTLAADCVFRGAKLGEVLECAEIIHDFREGGIGIYLDSRPGEIDRIHLDVRKGKARWGFVDGKKCTFSEALSELKRRNS